MLAAMSPGSDVKRYFRGTVPRLALAVIVLMPLLYGAMYLWAFWNPFGEADKMPVAIVNADKGATIQGKQMNVGEQVTTGLVDSKQLDLAVVSAEEAERGVAHGKYYFSVTLPENFSEAVASPQGDNPEKANLIFTYNDANNYLATIIGQDAASQVVNQVSAQVGAQSVGTVLTGLSEAGSGLKKAANGADQLNSGLVTANDGARQLAAGSRTLADNMVTARDGSAQLASATAQISTAITSATDPLLAAMNSGAGTVDLDQFAVSTSGLSSRIETIAAGIDGLSGAQSQAAQRVDQVVAALRANPDPTVQAVVDTLAPVTDLLRTPTLDPGTTRELEQIRTDARVLSDQLADPTSPLRVGLTLLRDGGLRSDVMAVRSAAEQLSSGAATLSSGLVELTDGSFTLADGAAQLADGTTELVSGSGELASALENGVKQVPDWTDQQRTAVGQTLSAPVALKQDYTNEAPTFGTGFAPFFMSLALFVGGIITWMLLTPLQSRPISAGLSSIRVVLASYWPALLLGFLQATVLYSVVTLAVGLKPVHPIATFAFLLLVTGTFMSMIQAFNAIFGVAVGRVVTLAFLMLQLVSAGGIYPVQTTAKPFQYIHYVDPMTYTVNGLRQLTVGGIDSRLWIATAVLLGITTVCLTASALSARRNRQYTMDRLYPPVVV
ncbi:putative membrane protein [Rhodococcus sp. 27YEA15]|uniref:YhgE/Pip family protein n=1 Tax=Rhodococcus sp. 27YEA15 TaxID=3156259 RepID=UPI003C7A2F8A